MGTFLEGYIACAIWASTGDDSQPLDEDYEPSDLAPETLKKMTEDCKAFQQANASDLEKAEEELTEGHLGHDFWLTRNHHGVGFWDRGLGDVGDRLTEASHKLGETDLYVGDDGKIYS